MLPDKDSMKKKLELPSVTPFNRYNWTGKIWSFDDHVTKTDFVLGDLEEICYSGQDPEDGGWDGACACVIRLRDGRYVAWETSLGPTGDGFNADAYGGEADIYVAATLEDAVKYGLTESGRKLVGIST